MPEARAAAAAKSVRPREVAQGGGRPAVVRMARSRADFEELWREMGGTRLALGAPCAALFFLPCCFSFLYSLRMAARAGGRTEARTATRKRAPASPWAAAAPSPRVRG